MIRGKAGMKKYLKVFLILLLVVSFIVVSPKTISASGNIKVLLEGKELSFDVPPQIIEGRTMLPLRAIFEALGLKVGWDDATRVITGTAEGIEIILKLDSKEAKVKGMNRTLDVPAKSINGRTLVPVRFIAESLDMDVNWNQESKTVIINKSSEIVKFKDPNFEKAVRDNIKKPEGIIYKSDVENVTSLIMGFYPINSPTTKVNSLEGIQSFVNLEELSININNTISNLTPIKNLINLKKINITGSTISDISPLTNLLNLESLLISDANIYDLTPINNLVNLKELTLTGNNATDITPLKNLVNLETLMISDNNISNVDLLRNLNNLKTVVIHNTKVSDISVLSSLPDLEFIGAFGIPISIENMAKVYQPLSSKGVHILTDYNESELSSMKIGNRQIIGKDLSAYELEDYLMKNHGTVKTLDGNVDLTFRVTKNDSMYTGDDYNIKVEFPIRSYERLFDSNRYSIDEKHLIRDQLRDFIQNMGEDLILLLPGKRLLGSYYEGWYTYPNLEVDYNSDSKYHWSNYVSRKKDGASKDYFEKEDAIIIGNTHYMSEIVDFHFDKGYLVKDYGEFDFFRNY